MSTGLIAFTLVHVAISLVAIVAGFAVINGFLTNKRLDGWNATFLIMTIATSVTGFMFPFHHFMPSHVLAIISLIDLPIAVYARYSRHLERSWRWIYVVTAAFGFYMNFFVLVAQSFAKIPALHEMAPTQTEPPFAVAQLIVLILFVVFGVLSIRKFHPVQPAIV